MLGDFQHRIYHSEKNTPLAPLKGEYKPYISAQGVLCWKSPYTMALWAYLSMTCAATWSGVIVSVEMVTSAYFS